jgi:hypothetical protein
VQLLQGGDFSNLCSNSPGEFPGGDPERKKISLLPYLVLWISNNFTADGVRRLVSYEWPSFLVDFLVG